VSKQEYAYRVKRTVYTFPPMRGRPACFRTKVLPLISRTRLGCILTSMDQKNDPDRNDGLPPDTIEIWRIPLGAEGQWEPVTREDLGR
jgi:hypothetical protein